MYMRGNDNAEGVSMTVGEGIMLVEANSLGLRGVSELERSGRYSQPGHQ